MDCVKPKKRLSRKTKGRLILTFFIIFIIFIYLSVVVNPLIVEASEAKIKSVAQLTLSNAILGTLGANNVYDDIVTYEFDSNNKISFINVDSYKANLLSRNVSTVAQDELNTTNMAGVQVHLGAFTGLAIFATLGPTITFNLSPIGAILVKFRSEFTTAGINQTLHKIYINVDSSVYVILPTASPKIDTSTEVLIAECVIVGEVPTTYLQSSYLDEMLNLVPI